MKGSNEEMESKISDQSNNNNLGSKTKNKKETSASTSKDNSKASDVQKPDFIHVRARRGQATDSHSLAERVSRILSLNMMFLNCVQASPNEGMFGVESIVFCRFEGRRSAKE